MSSSTLRSTPQSLDPGQQDCGTWSPQLNGGLYTGEPFRAGAAYANLAVAPDVDYLIHCNLRSAGPPPGAITQYPGGTRPGNNTQQMPGVIYAARDVWQAALCSSETHRAACRLPKRGTDKGHGAAACTCSRH
jgi:hypothetical protein